MELTTDNLKEEKKVREFIYMCMYLGAIINNYSSSPNGL